ncbi:hypothetical protein ACWGN5_38445 [Streptomyces sp. NPDC055815]
MSIWSPQDVARDSVRRQAAGLDAEQIADKVAEAAERERETARDARRGMVPETDLLVAVDPQRLAETWAAKHTEWRRIQDLLAVASASVYDPDADATGTGWEHERATYRQQHLAAAEAHQARRREEASAITPQLWLTAAQAAPVRQAAARTGLTLEQILIQLAARIETGPDGTLSVPPFHPDHI